MPYRTRETFSPSSIRKFENDQIDFVNRSASGDCCRFERNVFQSNARIWARSPYFGQNFLSSFINISKLKKRFFRISSRARSVDFAVEGRNRLLSILPSPPVFTTIAKKRRFPVRKRLFARLDRAFATPSFSPRRYFSSSESVPVLRPTPAFAKESISALIGDSVKTDAFSSQGSETMKTLPNPG